MPIKERRTKILFLLFIATDVNFDFIEISPFFQKIFDLTLNQKTKGTLSALIKEGLIEKADQNEEKGTKYKLTEKGYQALCLNFPSFRFLKDEWDGLWRIISYEIPEAKREIRDRLRREMRGWGLGPWHRSFWVTPHPIISELKDLVYGREEEKYVQAFESTHVFGDMDNLIEKVWRKSELEKLYRDVFKKWHQTLSSEKSKEDKMKDILRSYIELLRLDPGLPTSLVGKKWIGFEAFDIFKEIRSILVS